MKVAVSLPDELSERADEMASRLGLNRSQLFATAIEEFLDEQGEDPITAKLDELAEHGASSEAEHPVGSAGDAAARRLIDQGLWEW